MGGDKRVREQVVEGRLQERREGRDQNQDVGRIRTVSSFKDEAEKPAGKKEVGNP